MLKILQARLQQYVNWEHPDVQDEFWKGRGTRDQIANICWIIEKVREFQKIIYFWFIDYTKAFNCVDCKTLWKLLKEMGIPDQVTCLMRNLYAGQEAAVKTGDITMDWFQIVKGICQGCILPLWLTSMQSKSCEMLGWIQAQDSRLKHKLESRLLGEISITSDMQTTPSFRQKVKWNWKPLDEGERGEWKSWLKTQHSENEDHGIQSQHFMANRWGNNRDSERLSFLGLHNHCRWWLQT